MEGSQSTTYRSLQVFTSGVRMLTGRIGILAVRIRIYISWKRPTHVPSASRTLRKGLGAFLGRPWFRRTWVRQEIFAARELSVQCGLSVIPWHTIKSASKSLKAFSAVLTLHNLHKEGLVDFSLRLDALRQASPEELAILNTP